MVPQLEDYTEFECIDIPSLGNKLSAVCGMVSDDSNPQLYNKRCNSCFWYDIKFANTPLTNDFAVSHRFLASWNWLSKSCTREIRRMRHLFVEGVKLWDIFEEIVEDFLYWLSGVEVAESPLVNPLFCFLQLITQACLWYMTKWDTRSQGGFIGSSNWSFRLPCSKWGLLKKKKILGFSTAMEMGNIKPSHQALLPRPFPYHDPLDSYQFFPTVIFYQLFYLIGFISSSKLIGEASSRRLCRNQPSDQFCSNLLRRAYS